jgi:phosphopantothenoylcysteine decarboxylase/phosphopantothenate--cysteine ligase
VKLVNIVTAGEMSKAVKGSLRGADVLVMAAAVGDYGPAEVASTKIKKSDGVPEIKLEPTEDILMSVSKSNVKCLLVGFAAETDNVIENARSKLLEKGLSIIVANKVDLPESGFGADTDLAAVITSDADVVELRMMSKVELSDRVLDTVSEMLE